MAARGRGAKEGPPPNHPSSTSTSMRYEGRDGSADGWKYVPMANFVQMLSSVLNRPVYDRTKLTGNFDIQLEYTPDQMPQIPPGVTLPPGLTLPSPDGPSLNTALQEQLGLKLEATRGPVDVLVIDSVEQPTPDEAVERPPRPGHNSAHSVTPRPSTGDVHEDRCPLRILLTVLSLPALTASPTAKPEEVGLSSERLARINQMIERRIAAGDLAGAVTIVARKGKVVHHSAQGVMDLDSKKPMASGSMFRIASMTKPVIGVGGHDARRRGQASPQRSGPPLHSAVRDMKVAVPQPRRRRTRAAARAEPPAPPRSTLSPRSATITIKDLLTHVSGLGSGPMGNSDIDKVARKDGETLARLHSAPRADSARIPAGLALDLQSRRRLRDARPRDRGRIRHAARSVLPHAHLRSARHEGHHVLADRRADAASGHRLRSRTRTD